MQTSGSHTQAYFILPLTFFFRNMSSCIFFFVGDIFILVIFEKKDNRTLIHVLEFKKKSPKQSGHVQLSKPKSTARHT